MGKDRNRKRTNRATRKSYPLEKKLKWPSCLVRGSDSSNRESSMADVAGPPPPPPSQPPPENSPNLSVASSRLAEQVFIH